MPAPIDCKVYVGDIGSQTTREDLEDEFSYYGRLTNVWVARNPPGFAFVEFEDPRDADDAIRALDGKTICGRRVRVELSNGRSRGGGGRRDGPPRGGRGRPFNPDDKCYQCGERGHYARDCRSYSKRGGRRSRSRSRGRRSMSKSVSRDRSPRRSRYSRSRSRSVKKSRDYSRSRTPERRYSRSADRRYSRSGSRDRRSRSMERRSPVDNQA